MVNVYPQIFETRDDLNSCVSDAERSKKAPNYSPKIHFVFLALMQRLLALHQASSCSTSVL